MIAVKVEVVFNNIESSGQDLTKDLDRVVKETAENIEKRSREYMESSPATGRIYKKPGGGEHQASAPYEPPAIYEGDLIASSYTKKLGESDYEVGFKDPKAPWLEFGTPRMLPRPFFRPAISLERQEFYRKIEEAFVRKR